jgi:hypothetical protein
MTKHIILAFIVAMLSGCATWNDPSPNNAGNIDYYLQKNAPPVALERDSYGRTRSDVFSCIFRHASRFSVADTLYICD